MQGSERKASAFITGYRSMG